MGILNILRLSNRLCDVLIDMELKGIAVDREYLDKLRAETNDEIARLERELAELARNAVGDTPVNFNSPEQLSMLLYSRKVRDKEKWAQMFNLGKVEHGATTRSKKAKTYPPTVFRKLINALTDVQFKTRLEHCTTCEGSGRVDFILKNGTLGKKKKLCTVCSGKGYITHNLKEVAGFKIVPKSSSEVVGHGFATSKDQMARLAEEATGDAKEFLSRIVRYNALTTYLSAFVDGIERGIRPDGLLHSNYNQTVTATGRLSSTDPNFYNQPRGSTFPIRRAIVSRFKDGVIIDADMRQLEFRVAVEMSNDANGIRDIQQGVDIHSRTAEVITNAGLPLTRQDAKSRTFKPLYGGLSGAAAERVYFEKFLTDIYPDIGRWHETLLSTVLTERKLSIPSGRCYHFTGVKRLPGGYVSGSTQIKNYPVQGFATADIVPLVVIEIWCRLRSLGLKTVLINFVYDSVTLDVPPEEIDQVLQIVRECMDNAHILIDREFQYTFKVPLECEVKLGPNWLDTKEVK